MADDGDFFSFPEILERHLQRCCPVTFREIWNNDVIKYILQEEAYCVASHYLEVQAVGECWCEDLEMSTFNDILVEEGLTDHGDA